MRCKLRQIWERFSSSWDACGFVKLQLLEPCDYLRITAGIKKEQQLKKKFKGVWRWVVMPESQDSESNKINPYWESWNSLDFHFGDLCHCFFSRGSGIPWISCLYNSLSSPKFSGKAILPDTEKEHSWLRCMNPNLFLKRGQGTILYLSEVQPALIYKLELITGNLSLAEVKRKTQFSNLGRCFSVFPLWSQLALSSDTTL